MVINKLRTNRTENPLGFDLSSVRFSFVVDETDAKVMAAARIEVALDEMFKNVVLDTGRDESIDSVSYCADIDLKPLTRYYWRVSVWADNDFAVSETAWFETAKLDEPWTAKWITPALDKNIHPIMVKDFAVAKNVTQARAYICGLGLYELYVNGKKVSNEYLTPHCNCYNKWIQYQTFDITDLLSDGNCVEVMLGNGWYKGRFGFGDERANMFGDKFSLICELVITYEDGTTDVIVTDESWKAKKSKVMSSSIYNGEVYDASFEDDGVYDVVESDIDKALLKARLSAPTVIKETIRPVAVITTPKNETVLDMGQNMVGWVEFEADLPKGTEILLKHGEILQDDCFCNANLRSAKAEYKFISNGEKMHVRPHFTFYGFRYVLVEGWQGELTTDMFTGCVVYTDMELTGNIETSDKDINRLFLNALWGQKGNFLDVPTDCPQRDERMGWTGDAQVFSGTACYNMDTYAFFNKYLFDMSKEQELMDGCVPHVIPNVINRDGGACAWADAATIIPWNVYLHYGDKAILEQQFESMKSWVDWITREDDKNFKRKLWLTGFHFGDWLALDGPVKGGVFGLTDVYYIASAYYCYSATLTAKAARVIGKTDEAEKYETLAREIKDAIAKEFFTETGRLAVPTQTGYAVALFMDIAPPNAKERLITELKKKIETDNNHLKTGFVGTPYLSRVLSDNGLNDIAYTLLLNRDYPSWLYEVIMGATTIWERWDAVLPDGKLSDLSMNSLNHYAYGSVVEWIYRNAAGIQPIEEYPGFRKALLAPLPDKRLKFIKASYNSVSGKYASNWSYGEDGSLTLELHVPFNATADLLLPYINDPSVTTVNGKPFSESSLNVRSDGGNTFVELCSGKWVFSYMPD